MTLWHRSNVIIYCNSSKPIRLKHTTTQQRRSFERWSQPRRWTTSGECDNKKVAVYFTGNVFLFATLSQIQKLLTTPYCSFLFIFFLILFPLLLTRFSWKVSMETLWARLHAFPETRTNPPAALFTGNQHSLPPFPPSIFQRQTHTFAGQASTQRKTQ